MSYTCTRSMTLAYPLGGRRVWVTLGRVNLPHGACCWMGGKNLYEKMAHNFCFFFLFDMFAPQRNDVVATCLRCNSRCRSARRWTGVNERFRLKPDDNGVRFHPRCGRLGQRDGLEHRRRGWPTAVSGNTTHDAAGRVMSAR